MAKPIVLIAEELSPVPEHGVVGGRQRRSSGEAGLRQPADGTLQVREVVQRLMGRDPRGESL